MLDKKDTTLIKLDCKSKDKVYDMLFGKADACLKNAKTVALLYLGSPYYMTRALEEYNIEEVNIFTTKDFKFIYEPFENAERAKIWYVDNVKDTFKECDMKFDCIIMNPPYQRNLHLKILAEAIKHLKDDDSKVVNLSPVRWLQDPLAKYKKNSDLKRFESKIIQHIISLGTFDKSKTDQLFNIDTGTLGIYVCSSKENSHRIDEFVRASSNTILDRVIAKIKNNTVDNVEKSLIYDEMDGISCVTSMMVIGVRDREIRMRNGWLTQKPEKLFYTNRKNDVTGKTYLEYRTEVSWGNLKPKSKNFNIKFNSIEERQNFYDSWRTQFLRYIYDATVVDVHVHSEFLPFLGNIVNSRTGLKGYQGEWTDDDLYKLFEISPEEQKVIEETMEKYK